MTEITGRVFPFTGDEQSEAEGIKESFKGPLCFQGSFCSVIAENYGYQVTTLAALMISGVRQNLTLKNQQSCWPYVFILTDIANRMIGGDKTHLYTLTKWMKANGRKEKIMWNHKTKFYIKA